jgi:hypothetical protein
MKTRFTKKLFAALAVAGLFAGGAYAQVIPGYEDGTAGGVANYVGTGTQATTEVTIGKTIPLFAWPDTYYHPSYDPEAGTGLTVGHTWAWTPIAGTGTVTLANASGNYVEMTGATLGTATVSVLESGPVCGDVSPQTMGVTVRATPTVSITLPVALTITQCEGNALLTFASTQVQATIVNNSTSNYRLVWSLEIYTESAGSPDEWFDTDISTSLGTAPGPYYAESYTQAAPDYIAAAGIYNISSVGAPDVAYITINNKTTVYRYTVTAINDAVSRRGDFINIDDAVQGTGNAVNSAAPGDFMYYDVLGANPLAATSVRTITVNPVPVTGPIYHISNLWAN